MRQRRVKSNDPGYYHIISRIIEEMFKLIEDEPFLFISILRKVAIFSGVRILDFVVMSNHFHLIVFASGHCMAGEEELIRRYHVLYGKTATRELKKRWKMLRDTRQFDELEKEKNNLRRRMEDISEFMKTLKQRFSMSYNCRHKRKGPLWDDRFKSILVHPKALPILAAYIALNPVRAGIVTDPKDYLFSGYGAAIAGKKWARRGLIEVYGASGEEAPWREIAERHRMIIYGRGGRYGIHPPVYNRDEVERVIAEGGKLTLFQLLRCRVRYFINGFALGIREFVEESFREHPWCFGMNRKTASRKFRWYGGELGELFVARDLRKDVLTPMKA